MAADLESFIRCQNENEERFLGNMAAIIEKVNDNKRSINSS